MNVSFTRARSKLIIFGSRKTLQKVPLLSEFFVLMDGKGWILTLPAGAPHIPTLPAAEPQRSLGKREAKEATERENKGGSPVSVKKPRVDAGVLKGRPILQDLINGEL